MKRGCFIAVEGIDGSGKTTFARALDLQLRALGCPVLLTQEPGGSDLGRRLRAILLESEEVIVPRAEFLLFAADRAQHTDMIIKPALKDGMTVISDRCGDSSLAYQGFGKLVHQEMISIVNAWAQDNRPPDLVFYLKIDPTLARQRIMARNEKLTVFEKNDAAFWQRVSSGFDEIFEHRDEVVTLDGNQDVEQLVEVALKKLKQQRINGVCL